MALTISPGELAPTFAARCQECKRVQVLEDAATRLGAAHTLEAHGWDRHPQRGWTCRDCRLVTGQKR